MCEFPCTGVYACRSQSVGYFSGSLSTLDIEEGFLLFAPRFPGLSCLSGQLVLGSYCVILPHAKVSGHLPYLSGISMGACDSNWGPHICNQGLYPLSHFCSLCFIMFFCMICWFSVNPAEKGFAYLFVFWLLVVFQTKSSSEPASWECLYTCGLLIFICFHRFLPRNISKILFCLNQGNRQFSLICRIIKYGDETKEKEDRN